MQRLLLSLVLRLVLRLLLRLLPCLQPCLQPCLLLRLLPRLLLRLLMRPVLRLLMRPVLRLLLRLVLRVMLHEVLHLSLCVRQRLFLSLPMRQPRQTGQGPLLAKSGGICRRSLIRFGSRWHSPSAGWTICWCASQVAERTCCRSAKRSAHVVDLLAGSGSSPTTQTVSLLTSAIS